MASVDVRYQFVYHRFCMMVMFWCFYGKAINEIIVSIEISTLSEPWHGHQHISTLATFTTTIYQNFEVCIYLVFKLLKL